MDASLLMFFWCFRHETRDYEIYLEISQDLLNDVETDSDLLQHFEQTDDEIWVYGYDVKTKGKKKSKSTLGKCVNSCQKFVRSIRNMIKSPGFLKNHGICITLMTLLKHCCLFVILAITKPQFLFAKFAPQRRSVGTDLLYL